MESLNLLGKTVAVTGATGTLGTELCRKILGLGASLVLVDRNLDKSLCLKQKLLDEFSDACIKNITADLSDINSVKQAVKQLSTLSLDILVLNAGAYGIKREAKKGIDNLFQINFLSHYYMVKELLPTLRKTNGRVVTVGSIAHRYGKLNAVDFCFKNVKSNAKTYGNAKRFLMCSLYELFKNESQVTLSVCHPGITFTGITNHYPKLIFAVIKHPMKVIFMPPKKAVLCMVKALFCATEYHTWITPRFFDIWGSPKIKRLGGISKAESQQIFKISERLFSEIGEN